MTLQPYGSGASETGLHRAPGARLVRYRASVAAASSSRSQGSGSFGAPPV